jgi:hypothetical protein
MKMLRRASDKPSLCRSSFFFYRSHHIAEHGAVEYLRPECVLRAVRVHGFRREEQSEPALSALCSALFGAATVHLLLPATCATAWTGQRPPATVDRSCRCPLFTPADLWSRHAVSFNPVCLPLTSRGRTAGSASLGAARLRRNAPSTRKARISATEL